MGAANNRPFLFNMSDKTWNELLFNFRASLAKADPARHEHPRQREARLNARRPSPSPAPENQVLFRRISYLRRVFRSGIVYFVQHPNGLIKIGFTANLPKRFRELQLTEHPNIVLLGAVSASLRYEKRLHKMFGFCRSDREWFNPSKLLLIYINTFCDIDTSRFGTLRGWYKPPD